MACIDCLDDSKTIIPTPDCGDGCNEDLNCIDVWNSSCIISNPNLTCLNLTSGVTLSVVLQAIDAKLCQSVSNLNSCKVRVSANDECCDFLGNKISVTNGLSKSILRQENNCETVNIAHPTWNSVNITQFFNNFTAGENGLNLPKASSYYTGTQRVHEVKLSGVIQRVPGLSFNTNLVKVATLPIGFPAPQQDYYHSFTYLSPSGNISAYTVVIYGNVGFGIAGEIWVRGNTLTGAGALSPFISLDGINYSI